MKIADLGPEVGDVVARREMGAKLLDEVASILAEAGFDPDDPIFKRVTVSLDQGHWQIDVTLDGDEASVERYWKHCPHTAENKSDLTTTECETCKVDPGLFLFRDGRRYRRDDMPTDGRAGA